MEDTFPHHNCNSEVLMIEALHLLLHRSLGPFGVSTLPEVILSITPLRPQGRVPRVPLDEGGSPSVRFRV